MKTSRLIVTVAVASALSCAGLTSFFAFRMNTPEPAPYVLNQALFSRFEMTKELQARYEQAANRRKAILDSLGLNLRLAAGQVYNDPADRKRQQLLLEHLQEAYLNRREEFDKENEALSGKYDSQVWTRLSQYAREFGELRKYDYIYGAQGDGALLYARKGLDITEDLLQYANSKYKGQ